ncbi:MAG: hypothetical protein ACTHLE_14105 [Agriterribacter sp.]
MTKTLDYAQLSNFLRSVSDFRQSEKVKIISELQNNRMALSAVAFNYCNLRRYVSRHNGLTIADYYNNNIRWKVQSTIIHLISNYLISVFSFIDFGRKQMPKLITDGKLLNAYKENVKKVFNESPEHRFIQDLRNYIVHNSFLNIISQRQTDFIEKTDSVNLFIRKDDFGGYCWSSAVKKWLANQGENIYIFHLLDAHYRRFINFQNWTFLLIVRSHYEQITELQSELHKLITKGDSLLVILPPPLDKVRQRYLSYVLRKSSCVIDGMPSF